MFGFLAPQRRIPKWRQAYARICQFQRRLYGLTSLPFLSYEATFLYRLAIEYAKLAGQHGIAESSLNPSGFVTFDGERVPGRSQSGEFIEAGSQVTAVSTNAFGVFVRKQSECA